MALCVVTKEARKLMKLANNKHTHTHDISRPTLSYRGTVLQAGRSRVRFPVGSLGYFIDLILLPTALWRWVRLSL